MTDTIRILLDDGEGMMKKYAILLGVALLIGLGSAEYVIRKSVLSQQEYEEYLGLRREKGVITVTGSRSFWGVSEGMITWPEKNNGVLIGQPNDEFWARVYWPNEQNVAVQMVNDTTVLSLQADRPDPRVVASLGTKEAHFKYFDLDLDGRLDERVAYENGAEIGRHIRRDLTWYPAVKCGTEYQRELLVPFEKEIMVQFQPAEGEWREMMEPRE